jgi:hypothetical protein
VSFYIKPANGLQLPEIMKWIKETCGFNLLDGRTGHIWGAQGRTRSVLFVTPAARRAPEHSFTKIRTNGGDRYQSEILVGEPPEWAEVYVFMVTALPMKHGGVRRRRGVSSGKRETRMPPVGPRTQGFR